MKIKTYGALPGLVLLILILFSRTAYAGTVSISLNLSNYDTFDETVEIRYSGKKEGTAALNIFNEYKKVLELEPGFYELELSVRNDQLKLFRLQPEIISVAVSENEDQSVIIQISDSAGLQRGANDYIHSRPVESTAIAPPMISEKKYEWQDKTISTGTLRITVPNITGVQTIDYSLKDSSGKVYTYTFYRENNFTALIELPYGRYTEIGNPQIMADKGIVIPERTVFEYDYAGTAFGNSYRINEQHNFLENPPEMQLRLRLDGELLNIENLYKFSGDMVMMNLSEEVTEDQTHLSEILNKTSENIAEDKESMETGDEEEKMDNNSKVSKIIIIAICIFLSAMAITVRIFLRG